MATDCARGDARDETAGIASGDALADACNTNTRHAERSRRRCLAKTRRHHTYQSSNRFGSTQLSPGKLLPRRPRQRQERSAPNIEFRAKLRTTSEAAG